MKNMRLILMLMLFATNQFEGTIRLLTFHYNRPDFIEWQKKCLDAFCVEKDVELIVFNDAPTKQMCSAIEQMCDKMGVQCIRFQQNWHVAHSPLIKQIEKWANLKDVVGHPEFAVDKEKHPSLRHCEVIQYALDNYGYDHDDIVGLVDGDMFMVRPFSFRKAFKGVKMIGTIKPVDHFSIGPQGVREVKKFGEHFWVALTLFDMPNLPDKHTLKFGASLIDHHFNDSGSHSYHYLEAHPKLAIKKFKQLSTGELREEKFSSLRRKGFLRADMDLIQNINVDGEFHLGGHFFHYLRSSFQAESSKYAKETARSHQLKTNVLARYMKRILKRNKKRSNSQHKRQEYHF